MVGAVRLPFADAFPVASLKAQGLGFRVSGSLVRAHEGVAASD